MTKIKDGGPAFPKSTTAFGADGMSLRDYFAAQALPAILTYWGVHRDSGQDLFLAKRAYSLADAMIKARTEE